MQSTQNSEPTDPAHQSRDVIERLAIDQRAHLERSSKQRSSILKQSTRNSKHKTAYISIRQASCLLTQQKSHVFYNKYIKEDAFFNF
ncbi:unnamed protein product [Rotaria sp. Silwood1]|nr:unnamed protein product [Rotaria sp. Silwood1]